MATKESRIKEVLAGKNISYIRCVQPPFDWALDGGFLLEIGHR